MSKARVATIWLDGCSGCHMSFLDMDERLIDLASKIDIVYGPYVDIKEFPSDVDLTLVEGAVANEHDLEKIRTVRKNSKIVVSFGDCAVTGNVPAMRNQFGVQAVFDRGYYENVTEGPRTPDDSIPALLEKVKPVHHIIDVDLHIPGCPPSADTIFFALSEILEGRIPELSGKTRFGK